jgi:hypothetical protein
VSRRSSRTVFDAAKFRADVIAYMDRWHLSGRALCACTDLGISTLGTFLRGESETSLLLACELADVCDLSLDTYRIAS